MINTLNQQSEEQNLRKVIELLNIFITTPHEVEKYVEITSSDNCICHYNVKILDLFYPDLQLINTKHIIKDKFKKIVKRFKKV